MKKILVTVVLGAAALAAAQGAQPAPSQPSTAPAQSAAPPAQSQPTAAPVIKDPAEYNAYVGAIGQKDPPPRSAASKLSHPVSQ